MNSRAWLFAVVAMMTSIVQFSDVSEAAEKSVREIQQGLSDAGYDPGAVDGAWGKRSISALRKFQKDHGVPPSGVVDGKTLDQLFPNALVSAQPQASNQTPTASFGASPPAERAITSSTPDVPPPLQVVSPADGALQSANTPSGSTSSPPTASSGEEEVSQQGSEPSGGAGPVVVIMLAIVGIGLWVRRRRRRAEAAQAKEADWTDSYNAMMRSQPERAGEAEGDGVSSIPAPSAMPQPARVQPASSLPSASKPFGNKFTPSAKAEWRLENANPNKGAVAREVDAEWVRPGKAITVSGHSITKGLVYFGRRLPRQGSSRENENCLVDPSLQVALSGDPSGVSMGYWPSYGEITPAARKSYLQWLSGPRSDPTAYIGYVFLYFYGLERRLMLDAPDDGGEVVAEVKRLLDVYGRVGSFGRYARELLAAHHLRVTEPQLDSVNEVEGNGYEVPTAIKVALGLRVRDGREIEPDLLLRYAMTHPESKVRTPARRAPELLRELFRAEASAEYPSGLKVAAGRAKNLKIDYRACSGSFSLEIPVLGGKVPDITGRAEPIGTARKIFERCSDQLDEYSRALGRSPGMQPTLSAISRLPAGLRRQSAAALQDDPISKLDLFARTNSLVHLSDLAALVGVDLGSIPTRAKLREFSQLLAAFGFGNSADPGFAIKAAAGEDDVAVFALGSLGASTDPTPEYRAIQLSTMLGMVIAHADGEFQEDEKKALLNRIVSATSISDDEKRRLTADVQVFEKEPGRLDDWIKRLRDVPVDTKEALASELVEIAASDGTIHPDEVKQLETFYRRLGLDQKSLYEKLHDNRRHRIRDEDPVMVIEPTPGVDGTPIPSPPAAQPSVQIDFNRLNEIRSETRVTANVLADIFDDAEEILPPVEETVADLVEDELFDGLDQRCGVLLAELTNKPEWSAVDFERLVRAAGLMPGAARETINDWAMDRFDELVIEGDDPVQIAIELLPGPRGPAPNETKIAEGISA